MPVEEIIIKVSKNDKELDSILDKMVKAKQLSKEQADQFRNDSKSFQEAAKRRAKLLDEEIMDLNELKLRKQQAFDPKEIEAFNRSIAKTEARIKTLGGEVRRQDDSFRRMTGNLKNLAATFGIAFSVDQIVRFSVETVKLAAKAEGIERAFNKLNRPDLLKDLNTATRQTVSNLDLMRQAVRANNFQIPLENLATYFEFATKRSIETGESVDSLVNSIVDGIGRKSTLVMDNLGISASQLQQEIKKTGDFGKAAANIISQSLEDTGDVADSTEIKIKQLQKAWQDFKVEVGDGIIDVLVFDQQADQIDKIIAAQQELTEAIDKGKIQTKEYRERLKEVVEASREEYDATIQRVGGLDKDNKLRTENTARILLQSEAVQDLFKEYEKLQESQRAERAKKSIADLTERIKEAASALREEVSSSDMAFASWNQQTSGIKELLENYDKYLLLLDEGKSKIEALIEVKKKEYKEFERTQQALILERNERERVNDEIRTMVHLLGKEAVDSIITNISEQERLRRQADELFEDQTKRDEQQAEAFDSAEQGKLDKTKQFAKEDQETREKQLEAEARIAQAQIELGRSVVSAFISAAKDSAEARAALLAFDKLAAVASIIINLQREIALNSSIIVPGLRDAANLQSRLRAAAGIATVVATAIPEFSGFAEGVVDLKGPGTETSDSIPALLSKRESVMPAHVTKAHKPALKAMMEKRWDDYVFKNYQLPVLKQMVTNHTHNDFNDRNIVDSLYKLRKGQNALIHEVKRSQQHQLSMR